MAAAPAERNRPPSMARVWQAGAVSVAALALTLCVLAPGPVPGETGPGEAKAESQPAESSPAEPEPASDYVEQAPVDVATILTDTSKAYLQARARLEAHPQLAAEAILDRLTTVPPPTGTDRKRLLDVLAALGLPDHVELFAKELRRAILRNDAYSEQQKALKRWLPLLVDQGPLARPALTQLVADKKLSVTIRAPLLDALVEVTPTEEIGALVTLVGRGARTLRQQLYRSLKRRASRDAQIAAALTAATDAALAEAEPARVPALLRLRGALAGDDDPTFTREVGTLARDGEAPFPVRVASLRALAEFESTEARAVLLEVATAALPTVDSQRGELLAWLALSGLPAEQARPLVEQHRLIESDAPRLAVLGFEHATLPADHTWLRPALDNPWPQVRQAAMARIAGPCPTATEKLLEHKGHLAGRRSEDDRAVARSAIQALGRCGTSPRLRSLLTDEDLDMELRAEAGRQLARLGDDDSIQAIGGVLRRNPERGLARRLASALRHMPKPTPAGDALLCDVATRTDEAGHAARESLRALHGDLAACH